jgi:DNA-binding CsgD family transcriptional regulator
VGGELDLPGARERWMRRAAPASAAQMCVLRELGAHLSKKDMDVDVVVQWLSEQLAGLYGDACVVVLVTEDGSHVVVTGAHHPDPRALTLLGHFAGERWPADTGVFARLAETGRPLLLPSVAAAEGLKRIRPEFAPYVDQIGVSSALFLPLRARGRVLGVLGVLRSDPSRRFGPADQSFLEEVADHLGIGIDAAGLLKALEGRARDTEQDDARAADLTRREREILDLLARGYTNRQVAERLFLSVRTVEWHRERIQAKLSVSGRAALVEAARERGLGG